jgi:hypothetical protein
LEKDVVEVRVKYDDFHEAAPICGINDTFNANRTCLLQFDIPEDMTPPILIHYELTNFHQNHRNYFTSRDAKQLLGQVGNQDDLSKKNCGIMNTIGDVTVNPCGLTANTFFNDYFTLTKGSDVAGAPLDMIEEGIAWSSDVEFMFAQPDGFNYSVCPGLCDASCCNGTDSTCEDPFVDPANETICYRYYYPEDDNTQYLYETYPDIISPIEGVTNEHFIVWMRIATQPTFRKLYGWINQPIAKGSTLEFRVNANYVVTRFRGSKSLILSTTNIFGGRNPYFGPSFIYVGYFCLAAALFFAFKHFFFRPRRLADEKYLQYKED